MKNFKLLRISLALLISTFYVFCACFIGQTDLGQAFYEPDETELISETPEEDTQTEVDTESEGATVTEADSEAEQQQTTTTTTPPKVSMITVVPVKDNPNIKNEIDINDSIVPSFPVETAPSQTTNQPTATQPPQNTTSTTTNQTTTSPSNGWSGTLSVKNNLSSASDYGQVVTADAYTIICRTVQAEMGSSFHAEALKAQAIAAYSYIKSQKSAPSLPLAATVSQQVKDAVSAVNGKAVYYNGNYAQTVYCASSAGRTANSFEVWGGSLPYLVSVSCPVDSQYDRNYGITSSFSASDMASYVKAATGIELSGDPSGWFSLTKGSSGYITYVSIGNSGMVTGQQFRANIMGYKIKSANFELKYSPDSDKFTITTYGYGHGVGMSQNGANFYAKYYGYNYIQILQHYFTGVTIK